MDNDGSDYVMYAAIEKLRYAQRVKQVNDELLEQLASSLRWLLHYSTKYDIPLPEKEKISDLIDKAIAIENKLPTNPTTQKSTPDRDTQGFDSTKILVGQCKINTSVHKAD